MAHDVNCPYCNASEEINHDDGYGYAEDETFHQECGECGKTFVYTTVTTMHYYPGKADCLNGGVHQYEKTKTWPPEYARLRCTICGEEKPLPPSITTTAPTLND